jgi:hypothetical protein
MIDRFARLLLIAAPALPLATAAQAAWPEEPPRLSETIVVAASPGLQADGEARSGARPAIDLPLRYGKHGSFQRLVFDWTRLVRYQVERDGDRATIRFD